ncbi:uncharacterized protein BP5553_00871 [Venustampulla echinocandica]|uniref:Uncharacterized protein n=1 Tax=Venustampulla echinocandica TaxID=2656787 RepID=A0A370TZD5_9HELO|nr:uncharacterized protein BP5553_00871 [Venustampulla echinocandica]RDL40892.1 hypothetical protein BP5553_00871 [Venustampulla echinocandica]
MARYTVLDRDDYRLVPSNDIPENYNIHGSHKLPKGYSLVFVPTDAKFASIIPGNIPSRNSASLSCSYSLVKVLVSLVQSLYAMTTLYRSKGNQIEQYGYAAFGLTVAPYAIMSVINLVGNLMVPEYPALYLVESTVMDEARKRDDCFFDGTVGKLDEGPTQESLAGLWKAQSVSGLEFGSSDSTGWEVALRISPCPDITAPTLSEQTATLIAQDPILSAVPEEVKLSINDKPVPSSGREAQRMCAQEHRPCLLIPSRPFYEKNLPPSLTNIRWTLLFCILVVAIQIAILGGLSRFRSGSSTGAQRAWTMSWLIFSIFAGIVVNILRGDKVAAEESIIEKLSGAIVGCGLYCAPAIGGFVVVGQMFYEYGSCTRIS